MKFSAERQEKKGPFGGAYYETHIKVTLTPEEEKIARKQKIMKGTLATPEYLKGLGLDLDGVGFGLLGLGLEISGLRGNITHITMKDLIDGIKIKVGRGSNLGNLAELENYLRQGCKDFKSHLEADELFGSGGSKREEEF